MNVRKPIDYSSLYLALDAAIKAGLPEMALYYEIGRAICAQTEKGAAVMAAEYLQEGFLDKHGFSPRNLRRMRVFYLAYAEAPDLLTKAQRLGWTQNVIILESCETLEERAWYLDAAMRFSWTKAVLVKQIGNKAWRKPALDEAQGFCYTKANEMMPECELREEKFICLSWQHLQKSHGQVCDEGSDPKSEAGKPYLGYTCGNQHQGDWKSGLSSGLKEADGTWHRLCRQDGPTAHPQGLRRVRSDNKHGPRESSQYIPHLQRRHFQQDVPPAGLYRPPGGGGGPRGTLMTLMSSGGMHWKATSDHWKSSRWKSMLIPVKAPEYKACFENASAEDMI